MTADPDYPDIESLMEAVESCDECSDKMCWHHKANYWMFEGAPGLRTSDKTNAVHQGHYDNSRYNGWERGYAYETRPGGFKAPITSPKTGDWMRNKEYTENRHEIKAIRDKQRNS